MYVCANMRSLGKYQALSLAFSCSNAATGDNSASTEQYSPKKTVLNVPPLKVSYLYCKHVVCTVDLKSLDWVADLY